MHKRYENRKRYAFRKRKISMLRRRRDISRMLKLHYECSSSLSGFLVLHFEHPIWYLLLSLYIPFCIPYTASLLTLHRISLLPSVVSLLPFIVSLYYPTLHLCYPSIVSLLPSIVSLLPHITSLQPQHPILMITLQHINPTAVFLPCDQEDVLPAAVWRDPSHLFRQP